MRSGGGDSGPFPLLTRVARSSRLMVMRLLRQGVVAMLMLAMAAFSIDCLAESPQQAMQCCHAMRCSSSSHMGKNCCLTMPAMRATLGQPLSAHAASCTAVLGLVAEADKTSTLSAFAGPAIEHTHAPLLASSPPWLPLRI
jgi:hypothetical protein